jgi:hypothetical protein
MAALKGRCRTKGESVALAGPLPNKPLQQPVAPVTPLAGQAARQAAAFAADAPAADWQRSTDKRQRGASRPPEVIIG